MFQALREHYVTLKRDPCYIESLERINCVLNFFLTIESKCVLAIYPPFFEFVYPHSKIQKYILIFSVFFFLVL